MSKDREDWPHLADEKPLLTYFNIKHLTPALGGQYFLAEYGQYYWLFCIAFLLIADKFN
jgi:hypothetical protein